MKTKTFLVILLALTMTTQYLWSKTKLGEQSFFQLTVYHYNTALQEDILDSYFQDALIPALHDMDIQSVGVFKAISNDTSANKTLYVLFPVKSLNMIEDINVKLLNDEKFKSAGKGYLDVKYDSPAYTRMETILLKSFSLSPVLKLPKLKSPKDQRVYELRSYESAGENIFRNKLHMFNEGGEIDIFTKLNFNAVFYGEVIAGSKMPNLMYMTTFENKEDRDAHWSSFGSDPDWKKLSSLPEYKNNVSHIDVTFLRPVDYSDY
ncbi:MAG: NIPSNAP family protein [Fermentimonas sp.]|nr:NIPSNAP family protein [Fermentimonas sp.]